MALNSYSSYMYSFVDLLQESTDSLSDLPPCYVVPFYLSPCITMAFILD